MENFEETAAAASVANRILGYVNAPSLFQRVIGRCVDEVSDMSVYVENRNILCKELADMGYEFIEPQGAFYMFPKSMEADDKAFCCGSQGVSAVDCTRQHFHGAWIFSPSVLRIS